MENYTFEENLVDALSRQYVTDVCLGKKDEKRWNQCYTMTIIIGGAK